MTKIFFRIISATWDIITSFALGVYIFISTTASFMSFYFLHDWFSSSGIENPNVLSAVLAVVFFLFLLALYVLTPYVLSAVYKRTAGRR